MNILVVHEVSYRKKVVYEYQDFAERLAALGHNVTVVDYDDTGDHEARKETISRTGTGTVTLENTPYLNLPIVKYLSGLKNYRKILKAKLEHGEVDVVLLYSVFINGVTTVRLCRKFGVPVVYRVLDIYHKLRQNRKIELPLYFGEKFIYRNADQVCITNDKLGDYIRKMAPKQQAIVTLQHGVDTSHFRPVEPSAALRAQYGIEPGTKVVLYLGTTYEFSGLDKLIQALPRLNEVAGLVKLMVVGGGVLDGALKTLAEAPEVRGKVILTGFKGYAELPDLLALADVFVNPFGLNQITKDIVPIKILQYLACGKATLSSPLPEVVRLFPPRKSGVTYAEVEPFSVFTERLGRLLADDAERDAVAKLGLSFIQEHFAVSVQIKKLEGMLAAAYQEKRAGAPVGAAGIEVTP